MINNNSTTRLPQYINNRFLLPDGEYNIKYLLNTILSNFNIENGKTLPGDCFNGNKKYKHIVCILLDGLGYDLLSKEFKALPEDIRKNLEDGLVLSKLSTLFPTTTTTVIPFIMTGYFPEESGIYEWWQYEHHIERTMCPLKDRVKLHGEKVGIDCIEIDPKKIFKESVFDKKMIDNGTKVFNYKDPSYNSSLNEIATAYGNKIDEGRLPIQRVLVVKDIKDNEKENTFHYIYNPFIDAVEHQYGVSSLETHSIVKSIFFEISQLLEDFKRENISDTQILIFADHGLTDYDMNDICYIDERMDIYKYLKKTVDGEYIANTGSPREVILHVEEDMLEEFVVEAAKICEGYGEVFKMDELIDKYKLFNRSIIGEDFEKNMGNVAILAYENKCIAFREDEPEELKAYHGGLSKEEANIPLMVYTF